MGEIVSIKRCIEVLESINKLLFFLSNDDKYEFIRESDKLNNLAMNTELEVEVNSLRSRQFDVNSEGIKRTLLSLSDRTIAIIKRKLGL